MGECTAIRPLAMFFHPSEYKKKIKISTRCFIYETLETLDKLQPPLNEMERKWFEKHPQFRHLFHMPRDNNHKLMGMWMLLLRNACIEKKSEAWFVVNGVPIRYGIREHALISGLNCRNYPQNWKQMGSMKFVEKHFGAGGTIRYVDVKAKIFEMQPSVDRLKMLVLYFLSSIIIGQTKTGNDAPSVEPFFLRAVDNLQLCKTFPWGRLSFDHMLREISHTMDHFDGEVKENVLWPIPGFCIPMELLAFEAIPDLRMKFRECSVGADETCPRMCKSKFKKGVMKGFPLSSIYEALGPTKHIESILVPAVGEEDLLHEMTEREDDDDFHDVVVDSWMKSLKAGQEIWFEQMYEEDLAARVADVPTDEVIRPIPTTQPPSSLAARVKELEHKVEMLVAQVAQLQGKASEGSKKGKKRVEHVEGQASKRKKKGKKRVEHVEGQASERKKKGKKRARE